MRLLPTFVALLLLACGAGVASPSPDGDASVTDGGPNDSSTVDATGTDRCKNLGYTYGTEEKQCGTDDDCRIVKKGCFCGSRPAVGISKVYFDAATACEENVAKSCALGCPNSPGTMAEDQQTSLDGGVIAVRCESGSGQCKTYLP